MKKIITIIMLFLISLNLSYGAVIYNSITSPLPGSYPSMGYEATSTDELGDYISFFGSERELKSVKVVMTNWACENDFTFDQNTQLWVADRLGTEACQTTPGSGFNHPITLNIYSVDTSSGDPEPGNMIATKTQNFFIEYRPSWDSVNCIANGETPLTDVPFGGKWYDPILAACVHGHNQMITFDFSNLGVTLPNEVIYSVAYNTANHGQNPIGSNGPYSSLNYGLAPNSPTIGTDEEQDTVHLDSSWGGAYCDNGLLGTDVLRRDAGCWQGYVPTAEFNAELPPSNDIGIGVIVQPEEFLPVVFLNPNSRIVLDDIKEPGAISEGNTPIVERINNYAFEGEQIIWDVLVWDKNGVPEKINDVYVKVAPYSPGNIEAAWRDSDFMEVNCQYDSSFDDYYKAILLGADRLVALQADVTEDNAGNGFIDVDPDDAGWDWVISSAETEHTAAVSPKNLYGVTAESILGAYKLEEKPNYFTAMEDVYDKMLFEYNLNPANPGIRSGSDVVFLMKLYEKTGDVKYKDLAEDIYLAVTLVKYASAEVMAETIRDVRNAQGWSGIIPWDLAKWVEAAKLLGYNSDAVDIANVVYDDIMGSPGYFDINDGSQNGYALGLTGVIDIFNLVNMHYDLREEAVQKLLLMQNPDGGFQYNSVYVNPSDLQSTAYAAYSLINSGRKYQALDALNYVLSRQEANGAFLDEWNPLTEYPEVDAESAYGMIARVSKALDATIFSSGLNENYNPETMGWYICHLTVEPSQNMHGQFVIGAVAEDLDGNIGQFFEQELWFFNPEIALGFDGTINFGTVRPGGTFKSSPVLITNNAEAGSGVLLDMYLAGTDFYDPAHQGTMCPTSNVLLLNGPDGVLGTPDDAFRYYASQGAYNTCENNFADDECYDAVNHYQDGAGAAVFNNYGRIIENLDLLGGEYPAGNVLSPGADMSLNFKLKLPEPCNGGPFTQGKFMFFGEAI